MMHDEQKKSPAATSPRTGQAPALVRLHTGISAWRFDNLRCWLAPRVSNIDHSNTQ